MYGHSVEVMTYILYPAVTFYTVKVVIFGILEMKLMPNLCCVTSDSDRSVMSDISDLDRSVAHCLCITFNCVFSLYVVCLKLYDHPICPCICLNIHYWFKGCMPCL